VNKYAIGASEKITHPDIA